MKSISSYHRLYKFLINPLKTFSTNLSLFSDVKKLDSVVKPDIPLSSIMRNSVSCAQLGSENVHIEAESTNSAECLNKLVKGEKRKMRRKNSAVIGDGEQEKNASFKEGVDLKLKEIETRAWKANGEKVEKKRRSEESVKLKVCPTDQSKATSLYSAFTSKPNNSKLVVCKQEKDFSYVKLKPKKEKSIRKVLSPEMVSLVGRWHESGYLNKANYLPAKELDASVFANYFPRDFLRFTAEKFGQDHQEIAKWLSGSNLKAVALFGCPSLDTKSVFAAKRLRTFFNIQEDIACRGCQLKSSCKFVNQRVWGKMNTLNLTDTMRVLTTYSMDPVPQLIIPKEINISINKLLKEVVDLSQ